jgi:hypothetical protein
MLRGIICAGHVACMQEMINAYKIVAGKFREKMISEKHVVRIWSGLRWLRTKSNAGIL